MSHRPGPSNASSRPGMGRRGALAAVRLTGASVRFAYRRPVAVLTSLAIIGGAGIFAWNATTQQTTRHPAPLFAAPKPVAAPRPVAAVKPEPQPVQPQPQPQKRAELPSPQTTGATRPEMPTPPRRPAGPDASGSIARAPERTAKPAEPKAADTKPAAQPRVASAQKALSKLGYGPIAADGVLGAQTKQALERFERDKKLPVTGDLGSRTARQLASLSGIAVQ